MDSGVEENNTTPYQASHVTGLEVCNNFSKCRIVISQLPQITILRPEEIDWVFISTMR